jgi:quercetin dioxygenase-like cupin family protein
MTTATTIHVPPGAGTSLPMPDGDHLAKVTVQDAEGAFEVFEVVSQAGPMSPPHVSPWSGVLHLLEGRLNVLVDGTTYAVEPGGTVVCPAGTPVTFEVLGATARFLAITSGNRAGRFFADFAASVSADRPVTESLDTILTVTQRHGVTLARG